jgi:hypothetical protein
MSERKGRGIKFFHLIIIFSAVLFYLFKKAGNAVPQEETSIATMVYIICCIPTFIYFNRKELNIPYLPFFCFVFFSYFSATVFLNQKIIQGTGLPLNIITQGLYLSLAGIICLIVAFYGSRSILESLLPRLTINLEPKKTYKLAIRVFIISVILERSLLKEGINSTLLGIRAFVTALPLLSIVLLFTIFIRGGLNTKGKIWLWLIMIPSRFLFILSLGGFGPLIYETSSLFYIYFYLRQRMPIFVTAMVIILFFFIWGARDSFRELTWYGGRYANEGAISKAFIYIQLVYERTFFGSQFAQEYESPGERLSNRTSHLATFIYTIAYTPSVVPYWGGYSYRSLFTSLIPRFLYPDKPKKTIGNEFGQRYRLLNSSDTVTSYNLPMLVEFYINFGTIGVLLGMFLLGLVLRVVYCLVNHPQCGEGGLAVGAVLFTTLLNIESDFSLVFGNVLQYLLLFYFLVRRAKIAEVRKVDSDNKIAVTGR